MTPVLPAVAEALERARRDGVAPALSSVVLARGALVHATLHGGGAATAGGPPGGAPLGEDDLFDVASLTKVVATATLAAMLVDEGTLRLDEPVARSLPRFAAGGKDTVTARHLLAHSSGLPAWRPWFELARSDPRAGVAFRPPGERPALAALGDAFARGRELVREAALAEPLEAAPATRALYSDPGFVALGLLLERLAGAPLARLAERRVFRPLGLATTFFRDGLDPAGDPARAGGRLFVPTGRSRARHEILVGAVHDDNAWAMGGVGGHAGVFSTARDVAALGQAWLDAVLGRASIVPATAAAEFARRDPRVPGSERALGWDTPSGESTSLGSRLGRGRRGAIGHLAYTGCSLWVDLDAEVVCALLTNHTHPGGSSDKPRIRALRRRFHDSVAEALGIG